MKKKWSELTPEQKQAHNAKREERRRRQLVAMTDEERKAYWKKKDGGSGSRSYASRPWAAVAEQPEAREKWIQARRHTFCAIEGEEYDGNYWRLLSSRGDRVQGTPRLTTWEVINWLFEIRPYRGVIVCNRLAFHAEHWLRDLTEAQCQNLAQDGYCGVYRDTSLRIEYIPGKLLRLADYGGDLISSGKPPQRSLTVYEVSEYFQDREWPHGIQARLTALEAAMQDLDTALLGIGVSMGAWYGGGPVATALLQRNRIAEHNADLPEEVYQAAQHAYFGGRNIAFRSGIIRGPVHKYDLRSAYAWAMTQLPSLRGGTWHRVNRFTSTGAEPFALWRVSWNVGKRDKNPHWPIYPFPWRRGSDRGVFANSLCYPYRGEGWYWTPLVKAAKQAWGQKITVHEGWAFEPATLDAPFGWLWQLYQERRRYREEDRPEAWALKIGLNAVYGKLCQRRSWQGREMPFRNIAWAGWVTARVQSLLLSTMLTAPKEMVACATDALIVTKPLPVVLGQGLGAWEASFGNRLAIYGYGLYQAWDLEGNALPEFGGRLGLEDEPPWDLLEMIWREKPHGCYYVPERRLVTHRMALAEGDFSQRCTWRGQITKRPLIPHLHEPIWPDKRHDRRDWCWLNSWMSVEEALDEWGMSAPYEADQALVHSQWGTEDEITSE